MKGGVNISVKSHVRSQHGNRYSPSKWGQRQQGSGEGEKILLEDGPGRFPKPPKFNTSMQEYEAFSSNEGRDLFS